ncbi:hypothetical protein ABN154_28465 [Klebsiella michiganensis]|uniref:hypothetical protein n=1 Tax=Klebsiella michiganensis TaxID=1134687 RepID=UPI0032DADD88
MKASESVISVDSHEMATTDFYPRASEGGPYSSQESVPTFPGDYALYFEAAAVIIFLFFMVCIFLRYTASSRAKLERNPLPAGPDIKPDVQGEPDYFHLTLCVEGPAGAENSVLSSLASRVVREAENLYIPGINRRDRSDGEFAWSVQTKFPAEKLSGGSRLFPETGWFERPDITERPVKWLCICLQYTAETSPSTLHALVDETGREVAKAYLKGGHCHGPAGYTFCMSQL